MKSVITFFVLIFVFGCASVEKAPSSKDAEAKVFNPSATKAVLYVYCAAFSRVRKSSTNMHKVEAVS